MVGSSCTIINWQVSKLTVWGHFCPEAAPATAACWQIPAAVLDPLLCPAGVEL